MEQRTQNLTAIGTIAAACGGFMVGGYYLGKDTSSSELRRLERDIKIYETTHGVRDTFEYLAELKRFNDELFELRSHSEKIQRLNDVISEKQTQYEQKVETLNAELASKTSTISAQKIRIAEQQETNSRLAARIQGFENRYLMAQKFSVKPGSAQNVLEDSVTIGVQSIYSSYAVVTILDHTEMMDVGESYHFQTQNIPCRVIYMGTNASKEEADFQVGCKQGPASD